MEKYLSIPLIYCRTPYICTHRCECPICRENSKSRLSLPTLFRAFTDTSVSPDPQSLPGSLHVPRGVPWRVALVLPSKRLGYMRGGPPRREIFECTRIYPGRERPPLVAWINSVSPSKCSSKSPRVPPVVTASGLFIPPRVGQNRILVLRSSVIRSSKLTTRTCFTLSGNYCFKQWKYGRVNRKNVKMHFHKTPIYQKLKKDF